MKRDFLLGGTKLPTGGAVRGAGGAMSPPSLYVKRGPGSHYKNQLYWTEQDSLTRSTPCRNEPQCLIPSN